MNNVFELFVNTITASINGKPAELPCSFALDLKDESQLNTLLARHDMDADVFLGYYGWLLRAEGAKPWAFIFFENEYCLAGHIEQIERKCPGIHAGSYSGMFFDEIDQLDPPQISFIIVESKAALRTAAAISPLLEPAWAQLADLDESKHWIYLSPPPPVNWMLDTILLDREILLKEREQEIIDKKPAPGEWFVLAQNTLETFGETERDKIKNYLIRGETECNVPRHLIIAAKTWLKLSREDCLAPAVRCMKKAEQTADSCLELIAVAETWLEFDRIFFRQAVRCLYKAEANAKELQDFIQCAESWSKIPEKHALKHAYQCMLKAEERARDSWQWAACAQSWHNTFGPQVAEWAGRCLNKAELMATTASTSVWCAETWHAIFGEDSLKDYRRCMNKAQAVAESVDDWINCAQSWHDMFDYLERPAVRECIKNAEQTAATPNEWCVCASAWREVFDHERSVDEERCLRNAEENALTPLSLIECAKTCSTLRIHPDLNVPRFLKQAEKLAASPDEWVLCAQSWRELWAERHSTEARDNARRCAEQAGRLAQKDKKLKNPIKKDSF